MHAMDTDEGHDHKAQVPHKQPAVLDGVGHSEDSRAEVTLEEVNDSVCVGYFVVTVLLRLIIITQITSEVTVRVADDGERGEDGSFNGGGRGL